MNKRISRTVKCTNCDEKGFTEHSYGDDCDTYSGCKGCGGSGYAETSLKKIKKGKGRLNKKFEITDQICNKCNGDGTLEYYKIEYGTNFFGQEYRKKKEWTDECDACFGTKKKLLEVDYQKCDNCDGSGKISYWKKGLFSSTKYLSYKTCHRCNGSGKREWLTTYNP